MTKVSLYGHTRPHAEFFKQLKLRWTGKMWFGQLTDDKLSQLRQLLETYVNIGYTIGEEKRKPVSMKQKAEPAAA